MLKIELACQEFGREAGCDGQTAWPLNLDEDQITRLMSIPGVFSPNTRQRDQLDGAMVWSIGKMLMLSTVLQTWRRKHPWVLTVLEIFRKEDAKLKRDWQLRMIHIEDPVSEIELTEVVGETFSSRPFPLHEEEVDLLVSNIGEDNQLWT